MAVTEETIISGTQHESPLPSCSLAEYLIPKMRSFDPEKIFQVEYDSGESFTLNEFLRASLLFSSGLKGLGLQQEDVVAFVSSNRSHLFTSAMGVIWAGGTVAPVDPSLKPHELKHMFSILKPKFIFCEVEALENVTQTLELTEEEALILVFNLQDAPEDITVFRAEDLLLGEIDEDNYIPEPISAPDNQLAFIIPSSGSTGFPKGVGLTHTNVLFQVASWESTGKRVSFEHVTYLHVSHFFWITGSFALIIALTTGMKRVFVRDLTASNILQAIHDYKPSFSIIAPSVISSLVYHPDFSNYDLSSMGLIVTGGSPLSQDLYNKLKTNWSEDIVCYQVYGMTEASGTITTSNPTVDVLSVGTVASGVELKIVDPMTHASLGANEQGEIYVRSLGVMKGYVGNPEETKQVLDGEGWYHTGDIGYYDDNHFLYIVDRMKEMIKVRNQQVAPAEIEDVIQSYPGVLDAGVAGVPHEEDMYRLVAFVVKQAESDIEESDICQLVKDKLSEYKELKGGVIFISDLPRTPTGKIRRLRLKEMAKAALERN